MTTINFGSWLQSALDKRGWNQSELSRRSGISTGQISRLINGSRQPGLDNLTAIAEALGIPPENILREIGTWPEKKDGSPTVEEANFVLQKLPEEEQRRIVDYIHWIADKRAGYDAPNIKKPLEPTDKKGKRGNLSMDAKSQ